MFGTSGVICPVKGVAEGGKIFGVDGFDDMLDEGSLKKKSL